jgi:multimeric flavodoxin WrbA
MTLMYMYFSPHSAIAESTGIRDFPLDVKEYSTFTGFSPVSFLDTTPSLSSSFSCLDRILGEIPVIFLWSSENLSVPFLLRRHSIVDFHRPPITDIVASAAQSKLGLSVMADVSNKRILNDCPILPKQRSTGEKVSEIIAIISSPRKGGNSETIVKAVAKGAESEGKKTKFVYLRDLPAAPCKACDYCKKNDRCIMKDEIADLIEDIRKCSGLILSAPLYFGHACAQYRIFEDRLYSGAGPRGSNIPPGKKVVSVVTCGSMTEASEKLAEDMNYVFVRYFGGEALGTIVFADEGRKDAAAGNAEILKEAEELGKKFRVI